MKRRFSIYERRVLLAASVSEVYAFHEDPRNITKISPPFLSVERIECRVPARAGEEFLMKVSLFRLPLLSLEWIGFWEETEPYEKLVDGAKKSPFYHWRHQHLFRAVGSETEMTDHVEYALPGGVLGRFLDATVMRMVFTIMFLGRHRATRDYFASRAK